MNHTISPNADFKTYLKQQLVDRCRTNPRYSMRAFAKFLAIEPSALSKIINGKRAVSKSMLLKLGKRLGLATASINEFFAKEHFLQSSEKTHLAPHYQQLQIDQSELAANWYHYAILELTRTKSFQANHAHIASRLGLSEWEVRDASERLMRLGMLDAGYKPCDLGQGSTTVGTKVDPSLLIALQTQVLLKAIDALKTVPIEERDQSTMTMAVSKRKLDAARKMIKEFRRELCSFLEGDDEDLDEVYHLSVSLYPVSNARSLKQPKKKGVASREKKFN